MRKPGVLTVVSLLLVLIFAADGQTDHRFVKFGTIYASDHPSVVALKTFQETIRTSLADAMTIQIFADAQLGSANDLLEKLQFGYLEMAILPAHLVTSYAPLLTTLAMPYLFKDTDHLFRVLDGPLGNKLLTTLEDANLIGLEFLYAGTAHIVTPRQVVKTPEDIQNMKMGIICPDFDAECQTLPSQISVRSFETLDATVSLLKKENVELSLQNQTIQALECSPETALALHLPQHKMLAMTLSAHTNVPTVIIASKRWFDTLPPDVQKSLRNASRAMSLVQRKLWTANEEETYRTLQAQGMELSPVDREQLRQAIQPIYTAMKNRFGQKFTDILQAILTVH